MVGNGTGRVLRRQAVASGVCGACARRCVAKDVPKQPFADLLKAFRQDQVVKRYATWEAVLDYCVYSANPVGRLVLYFCDYRDEERQRLSDATCTALQLANFWQDVSRDLEKGRIYIPLDRAAAHGVSEQDIVERKFDQRYVALMKELIEYTRGFFEEGHAAVENGGREVERGSGDVQPRAAWRCLDAIESIGLRHAEPAAGSKQREASAAAGTRDCGACCGEKRPTLDNEDSGESPGAPDAKCSGDRSDVAESYEECHRLLERGAQQLLSGVFSAAQSRSAMASWRCMRSCD